MPNVALVQSELLTTLSDELPSNVNRASLVSSMVSAYGFHSQCEIIKLKPATRDQLAQFHEVGFVNELLKPRAVAISGVKQDKLVRLGIGSEILNRHGDEDQHAVLERYSLLYDCPVFPLMDQYVKYLAGSTISTAHHLINNESNIAINWFGGRHHAKKSKASGFCYVNDIVLGILELRKKFEKVVYVDFDLHHGDGVENAFKFSDKVITMSIHRKEIGFFPGSGDLKDQGMGKGKGYTFNAPMKHGLGDEGLMEVVKRCMIPVISKFEADCLVIQCGVDGLGSDEHQEWNLTIKGLSNAINEIILLEKPTMILGGGGYNHSQVARCWTYITSLVLKSDTQFDLMPDELVEAGEEYEFWNEKGRNMIDENTTDYIDLIALDFSQRSWM
jgi:histone deacetylase HOS1